VTAECDFGELRVSSDVAVDQSNNLYISDWQGYRIRKVTSAGSSLQLPEPASPVPTEITAGS